MTKPCATCHNKPMKNGYYKAELLDRFINYLPTTNKIYCSASSPTLTLDKLKPNTSIFYFAPKNREFTKPIQMRYSAYSKLENSGVAKVNSKGETVVHLKFPQVYINEDDKKVYHRHFHFIYWDSKNNIWDKNLYTQKIIWNVNESFVKKNLKKAIIIDALPLNHYNEKHIKGAYSLPYNKRWTEKDVEKIVGKNKLKPIIVYCWNKKCDAAEKVCIRLNKMGYYNLVHYENGICEWSGPVESFIQK